MDSKREPRISSRGQQNGQRHEREHDREREHEHGHKHELDHDNHEHEHGHKHEHELDHDNHEHEHEQNHKHNANDEHDHNHHAHFHQHNHDHQRELGHKHDHVNNGHGHEHDHRDPANHLHNHDDHDHRVHENRDDDHDHDDDQDHDHSHSHHGHHHSHHHGHGHGHGHHHAHMPNNKAGLTIALAITAGIMLLEFIGGLFTNSLALLSDSGHMLSDAGALALSLFALWIAAKPPSARRSFGFARFEVLAALVNGATLFAIAGFIVWEAAERIMEPPAVSGGPMMLIACIGLFANLVSAWFLLRKADVKDNLNVRSAYLHVLGDALGSVGAILAGLLMLAFGWYIADPIISVIVALLILRGAWDVLKTSVHILMEGTPHRVDAMSVQRSLERIEGVLDVHDLHIWTISSGLDALSCHLLIEDTADGQAILQKAIDCLEAKYGIQHATVQIETSALKHAVLKV